MPKFTIAADPKEQEFRSLLGTICRLANGGLHLSEQDKKIIAAVKDEDYPSEINLKSLFNHW